jgi:hypothetical protein
MLSEVRNAMRAYSWFQPTPCNFRASKGQLSIWRRRRRYFENSRPLQLLKRIEAERAHVADRTMAEDANLYWLLHYREEIRKRFSGNNAIVGPSEADVIHYYMAHCPPAMIPICIWLISRCANRFRLYGIAEFARDPSPKIRKHVAKALRRLEAWTLLGEMATLYPEDANICWYAQAHTTPRSFPERLANFSRNVDDSHAGEVFTPSRMPFWALERSWERTPPKSVLFIRRMLRRIRRWVRAGASR